MAAALTFDSFLALPSSQVALEAATRWASGRAPRVLCLAGPAATGKTHLARAAAAEVVAQGGWSCARWLSADRVAQLTVEEARDGMARYQRWALDADLLFVEHIEDLEGREQTLSVVEELLGRSPARALLTATCDVAAQLPDVLAALGRLGARVAFTRRPGLWERGHLAAALGRRAGLTDLPPTWWRHCRNAAELAGEVHLRQALRDSHALVHDGW